jgi:hypothetical protein
MFQFALFYSLFLPCSLITHISCSQAMSVCFKLI